VPAPALGQHSQTVLAELLGYDATRCAALAAVGAFGKAQDGRQNGDRNE
jgi:crotonobetainyl-CoA:carnitine CoA-transferase CaiB-like acyl-CoA transferase